MKPNLTASWKMLAAVPLMGGASVYAAGEEDAQKVKVRDLPLYDAPKKPELIFIDEKVSPLRPYISAVRKVIWKYADATKDTTDKVKSAFVTTKKYTSETLAWVREDTAVLQRAGIITVAGLGGLIVAGRKGGILRTTAYAGTSMVVTAAVVYPKQAVDITARNWDKVKQEANSMWTQTTTPNTSSTPESQTAPVAAPTAAPAKDVKVEITAPETVTDIKEVTKDFGMSKTEDKDMYSTRE